MEQFSLEKYLENPSRKVVTRNGRPVRIVCWDSPNKIFPIVGFVDNKEEIFVWDCFGYCREGHIESDFDLFFSDEKKTNKILDELKSYLKNTPKEQVEKDWKEIQDWYVQHFTNEKRDGEEELIEFKPKFTYNEKDYSELANKLIEFRNNTPLCSVSYRDGEGRKVILHYEKEIIELVKNEILKDLPKWKKATEYKNFKINEACILDDDIYPIIAPNVNIGEYYIELDELKNLPLEE